MNNRDYKKFASGLFFHVFNRGNGKQSTYLDNMDFGVFMKRMRENILPEIFRQEHKDQGIRRQFLPEGSFSLLVYTLMPNHFHFIIRQNSSVSIALLIKKLCTSYSKYFNTKYERVGSLFQPKFRAVHIENDSYLMWLSAYIHQNPKVAGLVSNLEDWPYSSYLDYLGKRSDNLCDTSLVLSQFANREAYANFVENSYEKIRERKDLEHLLIDDDEQ